MTAPPRRARPRPRRTPTSRSSGCATPAGGWRPRCCSCSRRCSSTSSLTSSRLRLDLVAGYLFERSILQGLLVTLELTVVAMLVGVVLGTVLAVMRLSENPLLRGAATGYVGLFRGTPILVQLLFWFFLGTVLPQISLGIPFGPSFVSVPTNTLITQFAAAILGLGLNEAAYMAEIVRAGIGSVDRGQTEAAQALGMSPLHDLPPGRPAPGRRG